MKRIIEPVKSILIAVLTVSMLYMSALLMSTDLFAEGTGSIKKTKETFFTGLGLTFLSEYFDDTVSNVSSDFSLGSLLCPYTISYSSQGESTGVFGSYSELAYMFDNVSGVISECLAGDITAAQQSFEEYLESDGTLIDFGRKLPLDVVCRLCANTRPAIRDLAVEKMFIYLSEDMTNLVFTDGYNTYAFAGVAVSLPTMRAGSVLSDAADLAAKGITIKRGSTLPGTQIKLPELHRSCELYNSNTGNYLFANLSDILSVFSINSGARGNEIREDGSIIYVENRRSIRVQSDGDVLFSTSQDNGGVALSGIIGESDELGYSVRDVIAASQKLLASFDKNVLGGEASLRFKNAYFDVVSGGYVTEFEYCWNGIAIQSEKTAAKLIYRNGYFISAEICFESYKTSEAGSVILEKLSNLLRLYYGRKGTIEKVRVEYIGDDTLRPQFCFYWE